MFRNREKKTLIIQDSKASLFYFFRPTKLLIKLLPKIFVFNSVFAYDIPVRKPKLTVKAIKIKSNTP